MSIKFDLTPFEESARRSRHKQYDFYVYVNSKSVSSIYMTKKNLESNVTGKVAKFTIPIKYKEEKMQIKKIMKLNYLQFVITMKQRIV